MSSPTPTTPPTPPTPSSSSTTNALTSAISSTTSALSTTTSALSSTLSSLTSGMLPIGSPPPNAVAQAVAPSRGRRTTISTHTSVHSELASGRPTASSPTPTLADTTERPTDRNVQALADDMFRKVTEYLKAEMLATSEDYKLLENMNNVTRDRYKELSGMAQNLMVEMSKFQRIYSDFGPYLQQIDEICEQVDYLEKVTTELDDYSKELEQRVKKLPK